MSLPDTVHVLPFEAPFGERTMVLHPNLIELDDGLLLVDTGFPHNIDDILEQMEADGFDPADIRMVYLTHQDGDHAGGLSRLLEQVDATVLTHRLGAPVVDGRADPRVVPGDERYPPARVDVELTGGEVINTAAGPVEVIPTPGHTLDHTSLYLPDEKLLIAGDALGLYDGHLDAPEEAVTEDTDLARESIATLATRDIEQILCYHGGLTQDGSDRLAEIATD